MELPPQLNPLDLQTQHNFKGPGYGQFNSKQYTDHCHVNEDASLTITYCYSQGAHINDKQKIGRKFYS